MRVTGIVGERGEQRETVPAGVQREGWGVLVVRAGESGKPLPACVGHVHAEHFGRRVELEREPEVAAGHAAVDDGVGGQLRDDQFGTLREVLRCIPGPQRRDGEQSGEPGASTSGRQELGEAVRR